MAKQLKPVRIWDNFDEWGLLNGLGRWSDDGKTLEAVRYPGETNKQLRDRLKLARKYPGNSTKQGMINEISRDLGISVSGAGLLPRYNVVTKKVFHLSEKPYPGPSGIRVFVSSSGIWPSGTAIGPQIRASGYADAVSGWIVWNQPDIDPTLIPSGLPGSWAWHDRQGTAGLYSTDVRYGEYTQILEFIGESIPNTGDEVKVEYDVQTGVNDLGQPVINTRSDFSHPDDPLDVRFTGSKTAVPSGNAAYINFINSGNIAIYSALDIGTSPEVSGFFYDPNGWANSGLLRIKTTVENDHPLTWGKFRYDVGRWDQLELSSIGNIPSYHDVDRPTTATLYNGTRYGTDLDLVGVEVTGSGVTDPWYPRLHHGTFYMQHTPYYMFSKQQAEIMSPLTHLGNGIYSGVLAATGVDRPREFDMILAMTSGVHVADNNPYIKQLHDFANPTAGVFYRTNVVRTSSAVEPSGIDYDGGYAFWYDYDSGVVLASGINPTGFVMIWEHSSVATSGLYTVYSGGYGRAVPNLNPIADPEDKLFYLRNY